MAEQPKYNFRDGVSRAPFEAMRAKKILVMTLSLVVALLVFDLFAYLGPAFEGENLDQLWDAYGFFPTYDIAYASIGVQIIYGIGVFCALLSIMLGMFAVAAIEVENVRGNPFMSARKALRFARQRVGQLFLTELSIIVFLAGIVGLFALLGLVGRIPYLGEWIFTLLFVIPTFVVAVLTLFIFLVLLISFLLTPAVAAAERSKESFQAILQTFSTVLRQPLRWFGYTLYAVAAGKLASFIYAYFCSRAVQFTVWASSLGGGDKIETLVRSGLSHLPLRSDLVQQTLSVFPGVDWSFAIKQYAVGGTHSAAGYLMSVMLFLIFASIIGYFLSVVATAQARTYIAIRCISDGYQLHTEESLFHTDEHINPPVDEENSNSSGNAPN